MATLALVSRAVVGSPVRQRGALVGLVILGGLALMALGAPWLSPRDPIKTAPRKALQPPGSRYVLGSDQVGRDVASRVLARRADLAHRGADLRLHRAGGGAPLGLVSGYYGGRLDALIMRVMDVLLAFPAALAVQPLTARPPRCRRFSN